MFFLLQLYLSLLSAWLLSFLITFPTVLSFLVDFHLIDFGTCSLMYSGKPFFVIYTAGASYLVPLGRSFKYNQLFLVELGGL